MDDTEYKAFVKEKLKLAPSWVQGFILISIPFCLLAVSIWLNTYGGALWVLGQIIAIPAFLQLFVIVHEAGHNSLLPKTNANIFIGNIASIFAVVPFFSWKLIHRQHHLLTGWRDRDPTTKIQVSPEAQNLNKVQKIINNVCWKLWIPLFSFYYRVGTYWNAKSILWAISNKADRVKIFINITLLIVFYVSCFYYHFEFIKNNLLIGFVISLSIMDTVMLSQHSHIPMPVSEGKKVKNFSNRDQVQFTRSLIMPKYIAKYIFLNFNYHELHHLLPTLPCYYLDGIGLEFSNTENYFNWVRRAKKINATRLVFSTRDKTNLNI